MSSDAEETGFKRGEKIKKSINLMVFPEGYPFLKRLEIVRKSGFEAVELNFEPEEEFNLSSSSRLTRLKKLLGNNQLRVSAVYSREQWFYPITSDNPTKREKGLSIVKTLIEFSHSLGCDAVLVIQDCSTVQMPLEDRTLFQMDQTTLTHQSIFRHIRKRRQNSNLDCDIHLRADRHYQERAETQAKPLHNSTNFERDHFRQDTYIASTYGN